MIIDMKNEINNTEQFLNKYKDNVSPKEYQLIKNQ